MEEGLAASRVAVEQRPESAGALANVGRALVHFERFTEAEEHLRRALELDPRNTTAHQNLAEALRNQGRHLEAVESYRAVLELDPGFVLAYAGLGTALFEARRYFEALAALEQALTAALRIEPRNPDALDHLAMTRFGQRRYEDALALYRMFLEIYPDSALTHSNVGAALYHLNRPQEALQSAERALGSRIRNRDAAR